MRSTSTFLLASVALFSAAGACSNFIKDYYAEIGCQVESTDESGCPLSYDCSSLEQRSKDKCHYNGREFEVQQRLESSPATACLADCHCRARADDLITNRALFLCARIECPERFRGPPRPGCYRVYEHRKCCMVKEVCGSEAEMKNQKFVCKYKDKTYRVGQKFYPEDRCLTCICQEGFSGVLVEPYCRKISCNFELMAGSRVARGCVPIYYGEKSCCPIGWRCPADTDTVVPSGKTNSGTDSGKPCKFGKLTLQVGERLSRGTETGEVDCSCKVPPHPVCVQKSDSVQG